MSIASNFNVPGFIKLFFPKQNVEIKYESVHEIPIMTIDKEIAYIPKTASDAENIIFLHTKNVKENKDLLSRFVQLKSKGYSVYLIPQQSPFQTFNQIKENTPKGLTPFGKMTINGQKQHPLIKFLKWNCDSLYDFKMLGSDPIRQQTGAFVKNAKNRVKYLKKKDFEAFLNKQLKVPSIVLDSKGQNSQKVV